MHPKLIWENYVTIHVILPTPRQGPVGLLPQKGERLVFISFVRVKGQ